MSELIETTTVRTQVLADTGFTGDDYAGTIPEVNQRILRSARDVHWEVIRCVGDGAYRKTVQLASVIGTSTYALPADFEQLRDVVVEERPTVWTKAEALPPGGLEEALNQAPRQALGFYSLTIDNSLATPVESIVWTPAPTVVRSFIVEYIAGPVFVATGNEFRFRLPPGGLEFIINDVAASLLTREQNESAPFEARRERARDTIRRMAVMRRGPGALVPRTGGYYRRIESVAPGTRSG